MTAEYVRHLEAERALLLRRQDALVRYLGRDEFLRAVGEAEPCVVTALGCSKASSRGASPARTGKGDPYIARPTEGYR